MSILIESGITIGGGISIGSETVSFTLNSSDFAQIYYNSGYITPISTNLGFAAGGVTGPGMAIYVARLDSGIGGNPVKSAEIAAYWTAQGWSLGDGTARIFDVTWGAGSSQPTGKVVLGYYYTNAASCQLNMGTVYTGDNAWQTPGQDIFNGPPYIEAGTFLFPATFTVYTPVIADNSNWC